MAVLVVNRLVSRWNGLRLVSRLSGLSPVNRLNGLSRLDNPFNRLNRLTGDRRGAILVQFALLVPIFVIIALGSFEVWKAISAKQSLHSGTYQAVRYLSLNPVESLDPIEWEAEARKLIVPELANNGFVKGHLAEGVRIYITMPEELDCDEPFGIRAELPWRAVIPYLPREHWVLADQHEGRIVCGP